jgi:hypothetical protein
MDCHYLPANQIRTHPDIVAEDIDWGIVLLNVVTGQYFRGTPIFKPNGSP